jgi:uncharacterized protein YkwD
MPLRRNRVAFFLLLVLTGPGLLDALSNGGTLSKEASAMDFPLWRLPSLKESQLVWQINAQRRRHGKPALSSNATLNAVAHRHARQMARTRTHAHVIGASTPARRIREAGYGHRATAENVAFGQQTAGQAVADWLASPGHRKNMLDQAGMGFTEVGVGAYREPGGQWYYCTVFGRPAK